MIKFYELKRLQNVPLNMIVTIASNTSIVLSFIIYSDEKQPKQVRQMISKYNGQKKLICFFSFNKVMENILKLV